MNRPRFTSITFLNIIGALIVIYLLVVLARTVKRNYDLGRQAEDLRAQITFLQDQKDALQYSIQYYGTDSYRQREARSKLGLQLPGEGVIIVPESSPGPTPEASSAGQTQDKKSNFQQWLDFLAGRNS